MGGQDLMGLYAPLPTLLYYELLFSYWVYFGYGKYTFSLLSLSINTPLAKIISNRGQAYII